MSIPITEIYYKNRVRVRLQNIISVVLVKDLLLSDGYASNIVILRMKLLCKNSYMDCAK